MTISLGSVIWASVKPIIKIYLIIGSGFILARMGILTVEATRSISDIVLTILLPCLSFNKIVGNIEDQDIKTVGIICLTSVLLFGTGLFFAYLIRETMPVPKEWYGGILAGGMFPNISDLPIAYLQTMDQGFIFTEAEGDKGVACVIIFLAMFLICVFNLGGFRFIEHDFKYKDEENGVTEAETASLEQMTTGVDANSNTLASKKSHSSSATHDNELTLQTDTKPEKANKKSNESDSAQYSNDFYDSNSNSMEQPNPSSIQLNDMTEESQEISPKHSSIGNHDNMWDYIAARRTRSQPVAYTEENIISHRSPYARRSSISASVRSIDQRDLPPQGISQLIREYSNVDQYGHPRRNSLIPESDGEPLAYVASASSSLGKKKASNLAKILTSDATVNKRDIETSGGSLPSWIRKFPLVPFVVFFIKNCLRPCSMAVILALIIAFIPWVKALFVTTSNTPKISQAPDNQPALSFLMDYTSYVGAASVPFGLILLGATLGRLKIQKLYPGFWKSSVVLVILKMCVMPIFGILWCDRLVKAGWVTWENDKMLLFVIAVNWALPTMTTLIYFTASYTPPDAVETIQMDCTSFFLMIQYPVMAISLPFVVSYFLKVQMKV